MLVKLAVRNVKKSFADYTIYFVTLVFAILFFYAFNSIDAQQAAMELSESKSTSAFAMLEMLSVFSIFVAVILGLLILYANNFLIKRRDKELGLYLVLGMKKGRVAFLFLLETLIVGLAALAAGLLLGILFSQGMSLITARLFETDLKQYVFIFSPVAAKMTVIYFGVIFVFVMISNTVRISKVRIITLIHSSERNEKNIGQKTWAAVLLTVSGLILIAIAFYYMLAYFLIGALPLVMLFGIPGTFLFFAGISGFAYKVSASDKKRYFKGLNLFVTRQITNKINTTHTTMALVCLMLFVTIVTLGASWGTVGVFNRELKRDLRFDTEYHFTDYRIDNPQNALRAMEEYGIPIQDWYQSVAAYTEYNSDVNVNEQFGLYVGTAADRVLGDPNDKIYAGAVAVSEFNSFVEMVGDQPIQLSENEIGIIYANEDQQNDWERFLQDGGVVVSGEKTYSPAADGIRCYTAQISSGVEDSHNIILVYPDEDANKFERAGIYVKGLYPDTVDKAEYEAWLWDAQSALYSEGTERPYSYFTTRIRDQESNLGSKVQITFIGVYLGVTFLITASVVLALQQISSANDNKRRYTILRKIGADQKSVDRSLLKQILIYFLFPLAVAGVYAVVGIMSFMEMINTFWSANLYTEILFAVAAIAVIYGLYMVITYYYSKRIIREKQLN